MLRVEAASLGEAAVQSNADIPEGYEIGEKSLSPNGRFAILYPIRGDDTAELPPNLSRAVGIERDHHNLFSGASESSYGLRVPAIQRRHTARHLCGNDGKPASFSRSPRSRSVHCVVRRADDSL